MSDVDRSVPGTGIPDDDPRRRLTVARSEDPGMRHVSIAGGTYTILVDGGQTAGHYCLIEMRVPPGGGPPPHRHDFEEMFTLLDGELAFTFRGATSSVGAGATVNVPANAPHSFKNVSDKPARMLCLCSPAGQEEFFMAVGDSVDSLASPPPSLSDADKDERKKRAGALMAHYRTEMVGPPPLNKGTTPSGPASAAGSPLAGR